MSIGRLLKIFTPPADPAELPREEDWAEVHARFGPLPQDFRDFTESFGSGELGGFITIFNPGSENPFLNFSHRGERFLGFLREIRVNEPELGITLYPEESGWLPFGTTGNGDYLCWRTTGAPDEWTVELMAGRDPEIDRFPMGLTDFLATIYEGKRRTPIFPEDVSGDDFSFVPFDPETFKSPELLSRIEWEYKACEGRGGLAKPFVVWHKTGSISQRPV